MSTTASIALSQRIQALQPSATIAMATKAKALKAAGHTVHDFSMGEPDFTTPQHICDAAVQAMNDGQTHYTPAPGVPQLREAVAKAYERDHGLKYEPEQVVISNGAKHSLHNVLTALCNPGDEVIIPAPYWVSYAALVELTGAKPVILDTREEDNFRLMPDDLQAAVTPQTKALLICSPSNPTGSMYSRADLEQLADICLEKDVLVISDEIYEKLVYDGAEFVSFATVRPGLQERTILVNGVSKSYAMTGWRIGWTLAPENVSKGMAKLQGQETSNPCSVSQYAALAAIEGPQECVAQMREQFAQRRAFVKERIAGIEGLSTTDMAGAFYAFINIQPYLGKSYGGAQIDTSADWCLKLLEDHHVATVMGSAFGAEGFVRLSYASSLDTLEKGFDQIEAFLKTAE